MSGLYCTRPELPSGLPTPLAETLRRTRALATLDEHARRLARALDGAAAAEAGLRAALSGLVQDGLLVSLEELCSDAPGSRAPSIESIAIVTCNRPAELRRCVESVIENLGEHGRRLEIAVLDDSRDRDLQAANRELACELARRHSRLIRYADRPRKAEYASLLAARAGVEPELVRFALLGEGVAGESIGANRNGGLLDGAGRMFLSVDDDAIFSAVAPPNASRGLRLGGGRDPTELWFYDSRDELRSAFASAPADVVGEHERVLGRALAGLASEAGGELSVEDPAPSLAFEISTGRARVAVSLTGVIGDSGHHAATALLTHDAGGTRARLLSSAASYQSALSSREVLRTVDRVTVSRSPAIATTVIGVDATRPLPPFSPGHRNEDGVFGLMLQLCVPGAHVAALPAALWHLPPERRFEPGAHLATAESVRLCELVIGLLLECSLPALATSTETRLGAIARQLSAVGELPAGDFGVIAARAVAKLGTRRLALLQSELSNQAGPDFWRADVQRYVERLERSLSRPEHWLPNDVRLPIGQRADYARRYVKRMGDLCGAWSALHQAASELGARGLRLATPLA